MTIEPAPGHAERAGRHWPAGTAIRRVAMNDGWPIRVADMPAATDRPRGTILFAGGRGDFIEKGLEACHDWCAAGWRVVAFDWRGQGGSGRAADAVGVGHIDDFGRWIDDLATLGALIAAESPGPLVLIGHSMGGHLVLRAVAEHRVDPAGAVLVAPMLGFHGRVPHRIAARITRAIAALAPRRRAWADGEKPGGGGSALRQAMLTRDAGRYADEQWWLAREPSLRTGPGSWGWVAAAYRSMAVTRDAARLRMVRVPVLALIAEADALVDARLAASALTAVPGARIRVWPAPARHELLREADDVRRPVMDAIAGFLDGVGGP